MDIDSPYNAFLGRPFLTEFQVNIAPWSLLMKFPIENGIRIVKGDQVSARECYAIEWKNACKKDKGNAVPMPPCAKNISA